MRVLIAVLLFGMSFLVTGQLLKISRGEGDLLSWALVVIGVMGFIAVLRARNRVKQGPPAP